jgi:plasmid stability protein
MKNVTVSLDDDTYRRARVTAAERGRSLSAMVRDYLCSLGDEESGEERRRRELRALFARLDAEGKGLSASENLTRDELYDERFSG